MLGVVRALVSTLRPQPSRCLPNAGTTGRDRPAVHAWLLPGRIRGGRWGPAPALDLHEAASDLGVSSEFVAVRILEDESNWPMAGFPVRLRHLVDEKACVDWRRYP